MTTEIKCSVSNCNYWQDMYCVARSIEVNADNGAMKADTSESTCCETFKPRTQQ